MSAQDNPTISRKRPPLNVVVVDDDVRLAEEVISCLKNWGYAPSVAHNGAEGIALCKQVDPDIVILDILMPGMHGFDVGHAIKKIRGPERPKILVVTGITKDVPIDPQTLLKQSGADGLVFKPFNSKELFRALERLFEPPETDATT